MTIELDTSRCPIIIPDTYGSGFQHEVAYNMWKYFKRLMINQAKEAIEYALKFTEDFSHALVVMGKFEIPKEYNFETDEINFTLSFDDSVLDKIKEKLDDEFFDYIKKNFSSYSGFISFYPVEKTKFYNALEGNGRIDLAIAMIVLYQIEKEFKLSNYQEAYLEDVREYASENGYFIDEEVS